MYDFFLVGINCQQLLLKPQTDKDPLMFFLIELIIMLQKNNKFIKIIKSKSNYPFL